MSGRQYSLNHEDDMAALYNRIRILETQGGTNTLAAHGRNQITGGDFSAVTATVQTVAFQYDFPFTSNWVTVIVEAYQTAAVSAQLDLYDLSAAVVIGASQAVTATANGTFYTFTTNKVTKNATTGLASLAIRASKASGTLFNVRPVWAGNVV